MLRMELPGRRKRGRPDRRFMDVVKEDMAEVEDTGEDTDVRNNLRCKILCGDGDLLLFGRSRILVSHHRLTDELFPAAAIFCSPYAL